HSEHFVLHCFIQDRWARPLLSRFPSPVGRLPDRASWWSTLKELTCLMTHDPKIGKLRGETLVRELLTWQLTQGPGLLSEAPEGDLRVSMVIDQMKRNFSSYDLSITELAKLAKITTVQLRTLFQRETGMGPKQFLQNLRMQKAVHFLDYTTMSVKEIATACGFTSDHYFHPAFRKAFSSTPSEYRKRVGR
ncbi:MAG: AraC family transcriptional regulator, partial [Chthoniobacterales bacterium]